MIPFAEYTPDLAAFDNPGLTTATNVIPFGNSYKSFASAVVYSNALTAVCQGAYSTRDVDANVVNVAGDATKLYVMNSAVWSDASIASGYTTAIEDRWFFTTWGNKVLATNFTNNPQTYTMGGGLFSNLTTAVRARYITTVRDFVVLGNTYDSVTGNAPNRVRWSGINDETSWTVSASTQADYQDIQGDGGWVMAVVGGEYGVIFLERAIYRMTYVGSPVVFQFDEIERNAGTPAPSSVVKFGKGIGYLGIDGFYIFDGQSSIAIGAHKIDNTFWADVDESYLHHVFGVNDPDNQLLMWAYPNSSATAGRPNRILIYNYAPGATVRWSLIDNQDISFFYRSTAEGYTLEGLDTISTNIDTGFSVSFDSRTWTGNANLLAGFNGDFKQVTFNSTALAATIETQETQLNDGKKTMVTGIRPMVDGAATISVQVGTRNLLSESVTWGAAATVNSNGNCPLRSAARYHRVRVATTGEFNFAQGIEIVKSTATGRR